MATPTYKISNGNIIDEDRKLIYVQDVTGNIGDVTYEKNLAVPGTFTATTNDSGYGPDSLTRTGAYHFLYALIKTTKGDQFLTVRPYDPAAAMGFKVELVEDGWHVFYLVSLQPLDLEGVYVEGEVLYDVATASIVRQEDGIFRVITPQELIETDYVVAKSDKLVLDKAFDTKLLLDKKKDIIGFYAKQHPYDRNKVEQQYNVVRTVMESAAYQFVRGNKYAAQRIVEFLNANHCSI